MVSRKIRLLRLSIRLNIPVLSSLLEQISLQHGQISFLSEDEVVQNLDAQDVAGLPEPTSHILVLDAWLKVAAGVVVGDDDGCCTFLYCFGEDLQLYLADCTL
jgi:hypothetical protein